jgi:ADP-ribose pyrophosphatase YjhB (NUDIX family)
MTAAHEDKYWKEPAVPRHVIQMLVIDMEDNILFLHRSNKVRSAKNVWSIPSGEHDIGETVHACACRELQEEYGLTVIDSHILKQYENIAGDAEPPHYHWVISIYKVIVDDVHKAVNKEPDKHDQMLIINADKLDISFFDTHQFHPSLHELIKNKIYNWL